MLRKFIDRLKPAPAAAAPQAPEGMRLYVVGDVHGRLDLLCVLADRIAADAASAGGREIGTIFLGDYVDRWTC